MTSPNLVVDSSGLVYLDPKGCCGPIGLYSCPDVTDGPVFQVSVGVVVEVHLQTLAVEVDAEPIWCRIHQGELDRFGSPTNQDLWVLVDGCRARWVGGRSSTSGQIWLFHSALPEDSCPDSSPLTQLPQLTPPPARLSKLGAPRWGPLSLLQAEDPLNSLESVITDEVLQNLIQNGYVIVDDALPRQLCDQLRAEMDILLTNDQMWESKSYACGEGAVHHSIVETALDYKQVPRYAPTFDRIGRGQGLLQQLRRLPVLRNLATQHLRLQINKGNGGCYTMHTDSGASDSETGLQVLQVSALFYLNIDWSEGDGGELRLYQFPLPPVRIAPLNARLVLFEPRMVHEVLPNHKKRYCFTLWCAAAEGACTGNSFLDADLEAVTDVELAVSIAETRRRSMGTLPPSLSLVPEPLRALFLPEVRPLIVRYVFRECELEAAQRSHIEGPQKASMLNGIAEYHARMKAQNAPWLRDLLEALPMSAGQAPRLAASSGDECPAVVGTPELAGLVHRLCPWWE